MKIITMNHFIRKDHAVNSLHGGLTTIACVASGLYKCTGMHKTNQLSTAMPFSGRHSSEQLCGSVRKNMHADIGYFIVITSQL